MKRRNGIATSFAGLPQRSARVLMPFVTGILIEGRPVASLRDFVRDTSHARTAEALVLERLREGLHRLCGLWGLTPNARPLPIKAWRDEAAAPADERAPPIE